MSVKTALLGISVSLPLLLISATVQDPQNAACQKAGGEKAAGKKAECSETAECSADSGDAQKRELKSLRAQIAQLKAEVKKAKHAAEDAKLQADFSQISNRTVQADLGEALDLIANSVPVQGRSDHSPSCRRSSTRARSLLTYYQWMHDRGHDGRAAKMMERVVKTTGDNASNLNSLAWSLMTEKEYTGKFNASALAIAKRMQKQRRLEHRHLDTVALAMFLNGEVKEAVKSQKLALKSSNRDEYRRRLMVYQAALDGMTKKATPSVVKKASTKAKPAVLAARD